MQTSSSGTDTAAASKTSAAAGGERRGAAARGPLFTSDIRVASGQRLVYASAAAGGERRGAAAGGVQQQRAPNHGQVYEGSDWEEFSSDAAAGGAAAGGAARVVRMGRRSEQEPMYVADIRASWQRGRAVNATAMPDPINPAPEREERPDQGDEAEWAAIRQNQSTIADLRAQLEQLTHNPPQRRRVVHHHPRKQGKCRGPVRGGSSRGGQKRRKKVKRINVACANAWQGCPCTSRVEGFDYCCRTCGRGNICVHCYHPYRPHQ